MTTKRTTRVSRSLDVWLAGRIGQDAYATMAQRLAWEVSEPGARPPTLVLYEPEPSITIGRAGSRTDIHLTDDELVSRQLAIRFMGRGGGAVLHGPGQVGIALFATLEDLGLDHHDVGGYLDRFESALEGAVREVRCGTARDSKISGVFGRTGLLAAVGVAIRRGVVWHGGFVNVERNSLPTHRVQTAPLAVGSAMRTMTSIEVDVQRRVRLQDVRSALVHQMVESFGFPQPHIQAGCPILGSAARLSETVSRAG